jgi:hypothetical protein
MSLTRPRAHQLLDIDFKQSVRVVTTTNVGITGSAPLVVDDVTLSKSDRVLVTGQNTASQNGIYKVTVPGTGSNGTWVRAVDANASGDMTAGMFLTVTEGTTYADTRWKLSTPDPITLGSTNLTFSLQSTSLGNNSFGNIAVGATNVVADQPGDLITFTAGNNMVISGNAVADSVTFGVNQTPTFSGYVSISGGDSNNSSLILDGYNQRGGSGYHGFLEVTNTYGSATNPSKHFRINSTGGMEIINSAYSTIILTLSDNGQLDVPALVVAGNIGTNTMVVTNGFSAGSINSTPIGNATASSGSFTSLQASGIVTLSPANSAVNLAPTGTGTVTIAPATQGSINKMVIGNVTAAAGSFTTLSSNSTTTLGATSATAINSTPIGNATPSSGVFTTLSATAINSTPIGNATPSTGAFTTLSSNNTTTLGATSATAINSTPIGNATPSTGAFTTLSSNNTTTLGATSATAINSTPIGNATPNSGAFTSLTANGAVTLTQNTASTSTSSGTLVVTGGTGISGNAYVGGNLVVTGNLTINGTTTTVNSTTTTVDDPIFTLGGDTAPSSDDNKDRGIEFRWHNGSAAKVGFFGYDDSAGRFTFIPDATNTSEVFSGTAGDCTFGTVYATATSAQYADLAEYYLSDIAYEPGTVVILGGEQEITQSKFHADRRIAGVISTQPAYTMNDGLKGTGLPVALQGRVPCKVTGYAHKGDLMVSSSIPGVAIAWGDFENPPTGAVIGKCLINKETAGIEIIEVLVGRI